MRCIFHLIKGEELIVDDIGINVSSYDGFIDQVAEAIFEFRRMVPDDQSFLQDWKLVIVGEGGDLLSMMSL